MWRGFYAIVLHSYYVYLVTPEEFGISISELEKMKNKAVDLISIPNIEAAKIINKY